MYTNYRNYDQLIRHLKHSKMVYIHDNLVKDLTDPRSIVGRVLKCKNVSMAMETETITFEDKTTVSITRRVMRYTPKKPSAIGYAVMPNGITYPVIGKQMSPDPDSPE